MSLKLKCKQRLSK